MRLLPAVVLAALACAALLLGSGTASAHALLSRSDPPINAALRESPSAVTLFMTEPLERGYSSVQVLDAGGRRRDVGGTEFSDANPTQMRVNVLRLDPGIYTVAWRTLSKIDGHTWNGSYTFSVLNPDGSAPPGTGAQIDLSRPGPPTWADAIAKALGLAALIAFGGALLFVLLTQRGEGREAAAKALQPLLIGAVAVGIAVTAYDAVAAAARLGGIGLLDEVLFETRRGIWLHLRWFALILAAAGLLLPRWRRREATLLVLGAAWLAGISAASHGAAIESGGIWGALFDALHLAAVAVWIGMLAAMLLAFRRIDSGGPWRVETVRRFSVAAAATVPILFAAGLLGALIQVPAARGLVDTDWGITFLVKAVVLLFLFAAAGANAFLLRPRAEQSDDARLQRRFALMMRAEASLAVAVIAVSAVLTLLPSPASSLPATERRDNSAELTVSRAGALATVAIEPNLVGFNTWRVNVQRDEAGAPPLDALRLRFTHEDPAVGPVTVPAQRQDDGSFLLEGAYFGLPGEWTIDLEMRWRAGNDLVASVTSDVVSDWQTVLPFGAEPPGALGLPLTQMDWNGVAALWALVLGAVALVNRRPLAERFGPRGSDASFAAGAVGLIAAVVLMTGLEVEPGRTLANPTLRTEESVARGEAVFTANCISCHGETGAGDGPLAGTLPAPPANFSVHVPFHPDGVLFAWVADGIPGTGMPAWSGSLDERQLWDVVNYLRASFDPAAELQDGP